MLISQLNIFNFRNLQSVAVDGCKKVNVFYGANGSGKTSVLESLFFLSRAKSFRTNHRSNLINLEHKSLAVSVELAEENSRLGIGLDKNGTSQIKRDGEVIRKLSEASNLLPVQLITPESFDVFWRTPKSRRAFFDFVLFHVEPEFQKTWVLYAKQLKQTNALLKQRNVLPSELLYWYRVLAETGLVIDEYRKQLLSRWFEPTVVKMAKLVMAKEYGTYLDNFSIEYKCKSLPEEIEETQLLKIIERDLRYKQVSCGPHKADYLFYSGEQEVSQLLSRGQAKMLFYLFEVASVEVLNTAVNKESVLLIDDLPSEVDETSRKIMLQLLTSCNAQLFITGIENKIAMELTKYTDSVMMFHVERGTVNAENMEQLCP